MSLRAERQFSRRISKLGAKVEKKHGALRMRGDRLGIAGGRPTFSQPGPAPGRDKLLRSESCDNIMLDRLAYLRKEAAQMTRIILVALGLVLFLTNYSSAQSYCAQVKQAVATYGYSSAKRYASPTLPTG